MEATTLAEFLSPDVENQVQDPGNHWTEKELEYALRIKGMTFSDDGKIHYRWELPATVVAQNLGRSLSTIYSKRNQYKRALEKTVAGAKVYYRSRMTIMKEDNMRYFEFDDTVWQPTRSDGSQTIEGVIRYGRQNIAATMHYSSRKDTLTIETDKGDVVIDLPRERVHCSYDALGFLNRTRPLAQGLPEERAMAHLVTLME